jgi:bifunctional non-homologous end joining protein LigD
MAKAKSGKRRSIALDVLEVPVRGQRRKPRDPAQPQLPLDPMPARVEPCLALLASKPPEGPEWAYEVKWDGYRLHLHFELGGNVRILTRGGHEVEARELKTSLDAIRTKRPAVMVKGTSLVFVEPVLDRRDRVSRLDW